MKLHISDLQIQSGKQKSGFFYKVYHVSKDSISKEFQSALGEVAKNKIFSGDAGSQYTDHKEKIIYLGLGDLSKLTLRKLASFYIKLGEQIVKWKNVGLEIYFDKELTDAFSVSPIAYQVSNSLEIGAFSIDSLSKTYKEKEVSTGVISLVFPTPEQDKEAAVAIKKSEVVSRYLNATRFVEHLPANHFGPEEFVLRAQEIAKENKLKITVFDEAKLKKEKMGGILSVAQGSDKKPKMIILEYNPKNPVHSEKLVIVGKGLTFDSGGISLKPSAEMHEMKYDMCGAATAIHTIGAIAALGLKIPVVAAIGVAENMPDASATKPGDVYTAYNGITVEVQNTDAEGRLVLGDVLSYVCKKYNPDYLIDLATLTGAVIIALGNEAAGVLSNSDELTEMLKASSKNTDDRIWELPLWDEYGEDLKSDIADVRNITGGRGAGTISAAHFLSRFIEEGVRWAHIDIAGTAWRGKPSGTQSSGPTGFGVRLLVDLAENLEKRKNS